jgi:hypothetical protein
LGYYDKQSRTLKFLIPFLEQKKAVFPETAFLLSGHPNAASLPEKSAIPIFNRIGQEFETIEMPARSQFRKIASDYGCRPGPASRGCSHVEPS